MKRWTSNQREQTLMPLVINDFWQLHQDCCLLQIKKLKFHQELDSIHLDITDIIKVCIIARWEIWTPTHSSYRHQTNSTISNSTCQTDNLRNFQCKNLWTNNSNPMLLSKINTMLNLMLQSIFTPLLQLKETVLEINWGEWRTLLISRGSFKLLSKWMSPWKIGTKYTHHQARIILLITTLKTLS